MAAEVGFFALLRMTGSARDGGGWRLLGERGVLAAEVGFFALLRMTGTARDDRGGRKGVLALVGYFWGGRGNQAEHGGLGQEGAQDFVGLGQHFAVTAPVDFACQINEGVDAESGIHDTLD